MTNDEIGKLRGLLEKATPGPWQYHGSHLYGQEPLRDLVAQVLSDRGRCVPDRDLIVAAVNALPTLLDTIEKLLAERDAAVAWAERLRALMTEGSWETVQSEQAWKARATAAEAQVAAMREGLLPFAEAADDIDDVSRDADHMWEHPAAMSVTAGDFRRARDLVKGSGHE